MDLCLCVYVCVFVCIYVCLYVCVFVCMYVYNMGKLVFPFEAPVYP